MITKYFLLFALLSGTAPALAQAEESKSKAVKVGIATILSGDLSVLGQNIVDTAETYKRHYAKHPIEFVVEDSKLSSLDGLKAYQKLINADGVNIIIGGSSSNGTVAAKGLIESSKTPAISVVTGGQSVDKAGEWIFRIGNSDTLNGIQEAKAFVEAGNKTIALLTEETEYTQDIAKSFRATISELGAKIVYDQNFYPGTSDFRAEISAIRLRNPSAIFMPTQTGTALGIFIKQWRAQGGGEIPLHTTFVAASNPDAYQLAGDAIFGVKYMAPSYDRDSNDLKAFFEHYRKDHGHDPQIPFHSAGTFDLLRMLDLYLDSHPEYEAESFKDFLLNDIKNFKGMMGAYSFDAEGNADLGFSMATIERSSTGKIR